MDLRNHLQSYLDCDTRGPAKHRRLSITAKSIRESAADLSLRTAVTDGPSTPESLDTHQLANERELWQERELKWLTLMEEIQAESEKYRLLAENRRVELDGEKRYVGMIFTRWYLTFYQLSFREQLRIPDSDPENCEC